MIDSGPCESAEAIRKIIADFVSWRDRPDLPLSALTHAVAVEGALYDALDPDGLSPARRRKLAADVALLESATAAGRISNVNAIQEG